jgi:hypothetical protein
VICEIRLYKTKILKHVLYSLYYVILMLWSRKWDCIKQKFWNTFCGVRHGGVKWFSYVYSGHLLFYPEDRGAHGIIDGWGTMLQAGRWWVQVLMRSLHSFNLLNPSSHTMALGLTLTVTEKSTRRYFCGKALLTHKANNLSATHKLIRQSGILDISQPYTPPCLSQG